MNDELLQPYLDEKNEEKARKILKRLMATKLQPHVTLIVKDTFNKNAAIDTKNAADVCNDAIQSALFALTDKICNLRNENTLPIRALMAYATVVAKRATIDELKDDKRNAANISLDAEWEEHGKEPEAEGVNPAVLIDQKEANEELCQAIWEEIKVMDDKSRAVLLLDWKRLLIAPVPMFVTCGVTTYQEVSALLKLDEVTLANGLCWKDERISIFVGLSLQSVRNRRSEALTGLCKRLKNRGLG